MATPHLLQIEEDFLLSSPLLDPGKGENAKSRGMSIEKKIEFLESLTGKVSNRRSRRWLNDRLLMELVPRLNEEEIRGLFAPPPWGDDVPPSAFSMTNGGEWDKFRNIDMDKEANIIDALNSLPHKRRGHVDADKIAVLNAWRRVDCRTRDALRRSFLAELIEGYEDCLRTFIKDSADGDVLELKVQDSFHRLLLHGVCEIMIVPKDCMNHALEMILLECVLLFIDCLLKFKRYDHLTHMKSAFEQFYDLVSVTTTESKNVKSLKMTRIKKKKGGSAEIPNITLSHFLRMSKEGIW